MGHLPIFLNLKGRRCVVIGGGEVAERKVLMLLEAGAQVRVVSPHLGPGLRQLKEANVMEYRARPWEPGDLKGFAIAFAATDDSGVHRAIAAEARSLGVLLNVADEPELCDFIAPSVVRRGDLQIAISTSGASPALASRIRRDLEEIFGPEYEAVTRILRSARSYLRETERDAKVRARLAQAVAFSDLAMYVRDGDWLSVDSLLIAHLGVGLARLGLKPEELSGAGSSEVPRSA